MSIFDLSASLIIILNGFVVILFSFLLYVVFKQYKLRISSEEKMLKQKIFDKSLALLENARQRSIEIIKESNVKSQEILHKSEFLSSDARSFLKKQLEDASNKQVIKLENTTEEMLLGYKEALKKEKEFGVKTMQKVSKDIKLEALDEIDEFAKVLHKETVDSEKAVEKKLSAEYKKANSEIENYKQEQIQKINSKINGLITDIMRELIGSELSVEQHENLVMEALNKAKSQL